MRRIKCELTSGNRRRSSRHQICAPSQTSVSPTHQNGEEVLNTIRKASCYNTAKGLKARQQLCHGVASWVTSTFGSPGILHHLLTSLPARTNKPPESNGTQAFGLEDIHPESAKGSRNDSCLNTAAK
ncbi:hypothetical protein BV898_15776 [Hypsibius exemplaris]|uniref:Uncharacterized protein n=1 Tax=Hypsibius exemplaris TaxID=2072580 RepID=A0A9X6NBS5_HYPEX|nr:hypothetical protein BV898_15776 [Hypsibius exemplaris]